jgi:Ca2+-transporting ATPase
MWHQKTYQEVAEILSSNTRRGISREEAKKRLFAEGPNELPRGKKHSWYLLLLSQLGNPLVYILLAGAGVTLFLKEWVDAMVIFTAMAMNVFVGFWQEFKSNNILEELLKIVQVNALVIRDGELYEIDSKELVPGDIVQISAGQKIPADGRIIESYNLYINQAALTGESVPEQKSVRVLTEEVSLPDRTNMAYMGTVVTGGQGKIIVVKTGEETEIGKIATLAQKENTEKTPLEKRIASLGKILALFVGLFTVIIFIVGTLRNFELGEILITSIAVAVAGVPEGLPAAISIILAVGAGRILKKQGVIKKLLAVETLGSTTVICTDKTGTLTEGKMIVEELVTQDLSRAKQALALANSAYVKTDAEGKKIPTGDPTDIAKLEYVLKKPHTHILALGNERIGFLEFSSEYKIIASLHKTGKNFTIFASGAPEEIIRRSHIENKEKERVERQYESLAQEGYRIIGLAYKEISSLQNILEVPKEDVEREAHNLIFVGFASIVDPLRSDVKESIAIAKKAGIRTIIITGDHKLTALTIAKALEITDNNRVLEGKDLENLSQDELLHIVKNVNVFSRVSPENKIQIINALKAHNEVVAMTGDGINDSPALVGADIGVAVGSGTDIAREASDLVLLNDSFSTIVRAIHEGRTAFDNIRKVSVLLLTSSFSEIVLIMAGLFIPLFSKNFELLPLPITALQILYANLVEDTLPSIAMAFEPGEEDIMRRPPTPRKAPILNKESKLIIFFVGVIVDIILVFVFLGLFLKGAETALLQTIIFAAIGTDTLMYAYSMKSFRKPLWKENLFNNYYLNISVIVSLSAIFLAIYHPLLNEVLGTTPLSLSYIILVFILACVKMALIEIVKFFFRKDTP